MATNPIVWCIGGLDPSGGAGILADQRMVEAMGASIHGIITCLTVQNHNSCQSLNPTAPEIIERQCRKLIEEGEPQAIKIGLLAIPDQVKVVADIIKQLSCPIIVDPVLSTSSGFSLEPEKMAKAYLKYLLPLASVLTPNRDEAGALWGIDRSTLNEFEQVTTAMRRHKVNCLIMKGGHSSHKEQNNCKDTVYFNDDAFTVESKKLTGNFRGTGCHFSAGIAAALANGHTIKDAIVLARSYLAAAMEQAKRQANVFVLKPSENLMQIAKITDPRYPNMDFEPSPNCGSTSLGLYPIAASITWLERFLKSGVKTVQLRIKDKPQKLVNDEIKKGIKLAQRYNARLFINDFWQEAITWGAYGVHLGQEDLDEADILSIKQAGLRLGISTHCYYELARALHYKPSYVALGPIFHTTCKSMSFGPRGIALIKKWVEMSQLPVVAIGGLKPEHIEECIKNGADGLAVISDITSDAYPEKRITLWQDLISKSRKGALS